MSEKVQREGTNKSTCCLQSRTPKKQTEQEKDKALKENSAKIPPTPKAENASKTLYHKQLNNVYFYWPRFWKIIQVTGNVSLPLNLSMEFPSIFVLHETILLQYLPEQLWGSPQVPGEYLTDLF